MDDASDVAYDRLTWQPRSVATASFKRRLRLMACGHACSPYVAAQCYYVGVDRHRSCCQCRGWVDMHPCPVCRSRMEATR